MYRFKIKNYTLQQLAHYTAAFVIITKAIGIINTKIYYLSIIMFILGGFILITALFQKILEKKIIYINSIMNFAAVLGLAITGFTYMREERITILPYVLFFASLNYLIAAFISIKSIRDLKLQKNI